MFILLKSKKNRTSAKPLDGSEKPGHVDASARSSSGFQASRRKWLFRLGALAIPILLLGLLESGLRMAGYGYPTTFFLDNPIPGQNTVVENSYFGWRFFPHRLARWPRSLAFSPDKPQNAFRVFVFGESAAEGDPKPPFGFARILQVLLQEAYPERRIEVINTAFTAINSHVIRPIAQECARYPADAWIIYMGNNEVVGPYGAGTVFNRQVPSMPFIRAGIALSATKTGQLLQSLGDKLRPGPIPREWNGMELFLNQQVRANEERMTGTYDHFQTNLREIIHAGIDSGAYVFVCTPGSNLRDCAPFGSLHRADLSSDEESQWNREYEMGVALEKTNSYERAVEQFRRTAHIDAEFAELHFRLARCLEILQRPQESRHEYEQARDLDTLRFRSDTRLNEIIRRTARESAPGKVQLFDAEALFARGSSNNTPGHELFLDHVHMTFPGNYLLARALAEEFIRVFPGVTPPERAPISLSSLQECENHLLFLASERLQTAETMWQRFVRPPFTFQLNHQEQEKLMSAELSMLRARVKTEDAGATAAIYRNALARADDDWQLHEQFALWLLNQGLLGKAVEELRRIAQLLPHRAQTFYILGNVFVAQGRADAAIDSYRQAIRIKPGYVDCLLDLGKVYLQKNQVPEAIAALGRAVSLQPYSARTQNQLGMAFLKSERKKEALSQFKTAIRCDPEFLPARLNVAHTLLLEGRTGEAIANAQATVVLFPTNAAACLSLGTALLQDGRLQDATEKYAEVVRQQPQNHEARLALANALTKQNRSAEAAEHLAAAHRLQSNPARQINIDW